MPGEGDPIEDRLQGAEQALQAELRPILLPKGQRPGGRLEIEMDPHNDRVRLLATALNNLGVGAIIAGVVAPTVNGTVGDLACQSALKRDPDRRAKGTLWSGLCRQRELPGVVAQAQVPNAPVYAQNRQATQQAQNGQGAHGYGVYSTQSSHGTWLFAPDPNGGSNS